MKEKTTEEKTYKTVDGVNLGLDDEIWYAAIDFESGNYLPEGTTVRKAIKGGQTAFWSNYEDCLNECDQHNSL